MAKIEDEAFDRHYPLLTYEAGAFMMEHLRMMYRRFDGDIVMAMVLGEIGHRNASVFMRELLPASGKDAKALIESSGYRDNMPPCNALSIAEASGIPRETVRRKIDKLVQLGWVERDTRSGLRVTRRVGSDFRDFDRRTVEGLMDLAARVRRTLGRKA